MTATWHLQEITHLVRNEKAIFEYLDAILRSDYGLTDCHVRLEMTGDLMDLFNDLETEIMRRIRARLPLSNEEMLARLREARQVEHGHDGTESLIGGGEYHDGPSGPEKG